MRYIFYLLCCRYYIILFKYKDEEDKEGRTAADTIVAAATVPAFSPEPSWKRIGGKSYTLLMIQDIPC